MVKLGQQIALGYNANPKREAWGNHIVRLFYAFKSSSSTAKVAGGKRKPGLLEALPSSREVKDAYEQIVLIASHILNSGGKLFSADQLKALEDWLQKNKPGKPDIAGGGAPPATKPASDGQ